MKITEAVCMSPGARVLALKMFFDGRPDEVFHDAELVQHGFRRARETVPHGYALALPGARRLYGCPKALAAYRKAAGL